MPFASSNAENRPDYRLKNAILLENQLPPQWPTFLWRWPPLAVHSQRACLLAPLCTNDLVLHKLHLGSTAGCFDCLPKRWNTSKRWHESDRRTTIPLGRQFVGSVDVPWATSSTVVGAHGSLATNRELALWSILAKKIHAKSHKRTRQNMCCLELEPKWPGRSE